MPLKEDKGEDALSRPLLRWREGVKYKMSNSEWALWHSNSHLSLYLDFQFDIQCKILKIQYKTCYPLRFSFFCVTI